MGQAFPPHPPRLALQRQMVEVLVDRYLDREGRRVAVAADVGPRGQARWPGGGVHAAVAGAAILLPLVLHEDELPLDDGDLLAVLALPLHLLQRPAALRARPVGGIELVHTLNDGQLRLRRRPVAAS